jgi:hypothetical protein
MGLRTIGSGCDVHVDRAALLPTHQHWLARVFRAKLMRPFGGGARARWRRRRTLSRARTAPLGSARDSSRTLLARHRTWPQLATRTSSPASS